jgi:F-type H+-transporting ATPase subunit delta
LADDSRSTDVGDRYAQALFDLALETGQLEAVEGDLRSLRAMIGESLDLRRLISSPAFSSEDKGRAIAAIADKAGFTPTTRKFLGLLAANGRVSALNGTITAFQRLSAKHRGAVAAEVTTAIRLTPEQQSGLQAALRQALGKDPEITTRVDPSILGGLRVKVGSRLYDASLRSKLDQMKFALKRA